jgi:hypothetical protein
MIPDGSPADLPENRLRLLINGRFDSGGIKVRGGQAAIRNSALESGACVDAMFDFQAGSTGGTPRILFILQDGCPGLSSSIGFSSNQYDHEQSPNFTRGVYYDTGTQGLEAAAYAGELYLAQDNNLRRLITVSPPYGNEALDIAGTSQDYLLKTFTGFTRITCMVEFDGYLYMGIDGGAGSSEVHAYNGTTVYKDAGSLNAPTQLGVYREMLIVGWNGTPNKISTRPIGDPAGTYTDYTPSGGTAYFWRGTTYKDVFYFATLGEDIFSFDGTTLTQIPPATTGIPAGSDTYGIEVFNDELVIVYTDPNETPDHGKIATFDGTTWTGEAVDLYTQDSLVMRIARPCRVYRDYLYVGAGTGASASKLVKSPKGSLSGTWTVTTLSATSGTVNELIVY